PAARRRVAAGRLRWAAAGDSRPVRLDALEYDRPPELIAQHPPARRADARLLVVERASGGLHDARIPDLVSWLRSGDTLALNETRVRPARLTLRRQPTGGHVQLLFGPPALAGAGGSPGADWRVA